MDIILSTSKTISKDSIRVLTEFDVESLKWALRLQHKEDRCNEFWLRDELENATRRYLEDNVSWDSEIIINTVAITLLPKATAICSYLITKREL